LDLKLSSKQQDFFKQLVVLPEMKVGLAVVEKLNAAGFEAYFAGGCVRDILLGRNPADIDVATSADPEIVEKIFPKTIGVGRKFGILIVVIDGIQIEVARFRGDGEYADGRHPTEVIFCNAQEDAKRRDFTVNGLFLNPITGELIDFVQGKDDLESRLLRAVGEPSVRFQEDRLRILRAIRLSAQLQFEIETETWMAICKEIYSIHQVSGERFFQELDKFFNCTENSKVIERLQGANLFAKIFPKLSFDSVAFAKFQIIKKGTGWTWLDLLIWSFLSGCGEKEMKAFLSELKCSVARREEVLAAMNWFWLVGQPNFMAISIGALIERSLGPGSLQGLVAVLQIDSSSAIKLKLQKVLEVNSFWKNMLPPPLIRGGDLKDLATGPELGKILKITYQAQLAQLVNTREEAVDFAFRLDCKNQPD
jgi:hypothetical protein